jgi:hypothetical protein
MQARVLKLRLLQSCLAAVGVRQDHLGIVEIAEELTRRKLEETEEYKAWSRVSERLRVAKARAKANDAVRELAVELYDGENKDVTPGAKIRVMRKVVLVDEARATEWIKANMPHLMVPDWGTFNKVVKAVGVPDYIAQVEEVPTAAISKDLTFLLPEEEEL